MLSTAVPQPVGTAARGVDAGADPSRQGGEGTAGTVQQRHRNYLPEGYVVQPNQGQGSPWSKRTSEHAGRLRKRWRVVNKGKQMQEIGEANGSAAGMSGSAHAVDHGCTDLPPASVSPQFQYDLDGGSTP